MNLSTIARRKEVLSVGLLFYFVCGRGSAAELPLDLVGALASEEFRERESAETRLLDWAKNQEPTVRTDLLRLHRSAADPEVRHRSLAVLKALLIQEYLKGGSGLIGISMEPELVPFPGGKPGGAVRITEVREGTPARKAELMVGDLIVSLNGEGFEPPNGVAEFRERVGAMKPDTEIALRIMRDDLVIELKLRLMRKPDEMERFQNPEIDVEASDRAAKEAFFREWLGRQ